MQLWRRQSRAVTSRAYLAFVLGGRRGPASLLLRPPRRSVNSSLRLGGRDLVPSAAAASVADGPRRGQVRNPAKCKVLEFLQEVFSALRGGIHDLLQTELDLERAD